MIYPNQDGGFSAGSPSADHALMFALAWAERLAAELPDAVAASARFAEDVRNSERLEDWSPANEEVQTAFRAMWTANAAVVWTGFQAQRWLHRLARELGEVSPPQIPQLHVLRNALEHLDEALFDDDGLATAQNDKSWSLIKLGGLRVRSWAPDGPLFALIDVERLRQLSRELSDRLDSVLEDVAEAQSVQETIDRMRDK